MAASVFTSFSTRRRALKLLGAVPALVATGAFHARNAQAADLASTTIVLGDQAGGTRALAEAAKVLDGTPYAVRWANFQCAAPLFEAQRAGDWALANPDAYAQIYATLTRSPLDAAKQITQRASLKQHFVTDADIAALQKVADSADRDAILPRRIDVRSIAETHIARG
jgi:hypothetical protein